MKSENSRVYKVTFKDGNVHYGRVCLSKGYSEKTYITNLLSGYKHNINNPKRVGRITKFEKRVVAESNTLKCEIVFEGNTQESLKFKDEQIKMEAVCMNKRKSNVHRSPVKVEFKVKKEYVKTLTNAKGEKLFYINRDRVFSMGFNKDVDFKQTHPLKPNFVRSLRDVTVV